MRSRRCADRGEIKTSSRRGAPPSTTSSWTLFWTAAPKHANAGEPVLAGGHDTGGKPVLWAGGARRSGDAGGRRAGERGRAATVTATARRADGAVSAPGRGGGNAVTTRQKRRKVRKSSGEVKADTGDDAEEPAGRTRWPRLKQDRPFAHAARPYRRRCARRRPRPLTVTAVRASTDRVRHPTHRTHPARRARVR